MAHTRLAALATHSTIFGFIQVGRHEFGQSWGAHIFVDGTVEYFFDAKRVLFDDEMILINRKYFSSLLRILD